MLKTVTSRALLVAVDIASVAELKRKETANLKPDIEGGLLDGGFFHLQVCYHPLKRHLQFLDILCQSLPLLDQLLPGLLSLLGASHNVALSFHPAADSISHSCDKKVIK